MSMSPHCLLGFFLYIPFSTHISPQIFYWITISSFRRPVQQNNLWVFIYTCASMRPSISVSSPTPPHHIHPCIDVVTQPFEEVSKICLQLNLVNKSPTLATNCSVWEFPFLPMVMVGYIFVWSKIQHCNYIDY